ncbi:MAG: hypothetical protein H7Y13_02375 [Sphingobacteriaceae bacterium]|nr:hypothetical protein [Sphingobacteriaceae bacterium]
METKTPTQKIKHFGREFIYQGTVTDPLELEKMRAVWKRIEHSTVLKKGNHLYASRFKNT